MSEMIHFIRQIQAYCQLEVIACSWKILVEFFQKREGDLDAMIEAHRSYLDRMVKKVFLLSPKAGKEVWTHFPGIVNVLIRFFLGEPSYASPRCLSDNFAIPRGHRASRSLEFQSLVITMSTGKLLPLLLVRISKTRPSKGRG